MLLSQDSEKYTMPLHLTDCCTVAKSINKRLIAKTANKQQETRKSSDMFVYNHKGCSCSVKGVTFSEYFNPCLYE